MTNHVSREKRELPEPVEIDVPHRGYQPSKAELEEEFDMPGMSLERIGEVFLRPVRITDGD